jgi:hypothetical protein
LHSSENFKSFFFGSYASAWCAQSPAARNARDFQVEQLLDRMS